MQASAGVYRPFWPLALVFQVLFNHLKLSYSFPQKPYHVVEKQSNYEKDKNDEENTKTPNDTVFPYIHLYQSVITDCLLSVLLDLCV